MPARHSHADHTHPYSQGGKTSTDNLAYLCERHHTLKHHSKWRVRHLPGGILEWTSPSGRIYRDMPPAIVVFTPSSNPNHPDNIDDEPPWAPRRT